MLRLSNSVLLVLSGRAGLQGTCLLRPLDFSSSAWCEGFFALHGSVQCLLITFATGKGTFDSLSQRALPREDFCRDRPEYDACSQEAADSMR